MKCLFSRCSFGMLVVLVLSCCFMFVVILYCVFRKVFIIVGDVGVCMIFVCCSLCVRNRLYVLFLFMMM